jgi:putative flippase GtrA
MGKEPSNLILEVVVPGKHLFLRLVAQRTENTVLQVPRALIAACIATSVDLLLLILLVECAGWHPQPAAVLAFFVGGIPHYCLCAVWVFPASSQKILIGFVNFMVLSLLGLGMTWAVIAVVHDGLQLNYLFAKSVAMGLSFSGNFLSRKYFIFKRSRLEAIARCEAEGLITAAALSNGVAE